MTEGLGTLEPFSLLGGPLHRVGRRLGLVRNGTNTVRMGLALGLLFWLILIALALLEGFSQKVFSLAAIGVHVRLLLAIPLFFVCETWVVPRMTEFIRNLVLSDVVPKNELPALDAEVKRIHRWKDSWIAEAILLLAAVLLSFVAPRLPLLGATGAHDPSLVGAEMPLAGWWYWFVCLPLFRFLMLRWLWRLGLWCYFLRRLAKLDLHLVPTHPDGVAGLGYLEVVHTHFTPLVLAISVVLSAAFAEDISTGAMQLASLYPYIALILLLDAVLFLSPLLFFTNKLWACRVKGLSDYMEFAAGYVDGFARKWIGQDPAHGNDPLGTPDLQSLADLNNSVNVVRNMRLVPGSRRLLASMAIAALLPMLPLLLLKYPVTELIEKLFKTLSGL